MLGQERLDPRLGLMAAAALNALTSYVRGSGLPYLGHLNQSFKARAKELHRALTAAGQSIKLMQVQEGLASALGFSSTNALQRALEHTRATLGSLNETVLWEWLGEHESSFLCYVPLYQLGQDFQKQNLPLEVHEEALLSRWSLALSQALGLPPDAVKDSVAVAWAKAHGWTDLLSRTPTSRPLLEPLLRFEVEVHPSTGEVLGYFQMSDVGHWIWDNLLGSEPDAGRPQDAEQARKLWDAATSVLAQHPQMYIAWAAAANAARHDPAQFNVTWSDVLNMVSNGLRQAQAQIPKGFRGKLPWSHLDNRPYLRMLHMQLGLQLQTRFGLRTARRTANKLLRLNPLDKWMHSLAPLILGLGAAQPVKRRLAARALAQGHPSSQLNAGLLLLFGVDGKREGLCLFIESIFRCPELGAALLADEDVRPYKRYSRPFVYGDILYEVSAVLAVQEELPEFKSWMDAVLRDVQLLAEEERLNQVIGMRATGRNLLAWEEQLPQAAQTMAVALWERYPFAITV